MPRLDEQLRQAIGELRPEFTIGQIEARTTRTRRHRRLQRVLLAVVTAVMVVTAGTFIGGRLTERASVLDVSRSVFPHATNTVLVLDDGLDGVVLVDLDRRVAVRRPIDGQRAGDQPHRLTRVGGSLIVGWGEVYAAPLDGGPSHLLGRATVSLPSAGKDHVWLVDYPGGRVSLGTPTLREVDLEGRVLSEGRGLTNPSEQASIGVSGGVAHATSNGIAIWNDKTERVSARLGWGQTFIWDAHQDVIAWTNTDGRALHISKIGGAEIVVQKPKGTDRFLSSRFSPDGRRIASFASSNEVDRRVPSRLVLIDVADGTNTSVPVDLQGELAFVSWASDGKRLYFGEYSWEQATTLIGEYDIAHKKLYASVLPFGHALGVVAVERTEIAPLLEAELTNAEDCPPSKTSPSGREKPCAFAF